MEYSIHPPSPFIEQHWQRLLPDWSTPVLSLLIILQRSPVCLIHDTSTSEQSKQYLRDRFIQLAQPIVEYLNQHRHRAEIFDPQTGFPYSSPHHRTPLNDVAVVHASLGYRLEQHGHCYCLLHPIWGTSVYPSIVMATVPPPLLHRLTMKLLQEAGGTH
ncbi:MAG: methylmalonic aciduria and homocystinuria type D protein [Symploca sp. SIO2B6]|nr:methylmalonic aciduria and homocystinuria type D protein [Symploca sp. SIO2B6]